MQIVDLRLAQRAGDATVFAKLSVSFFSAANARGTGAHDNGDTMRANAFFEFVN